MSTYIRYPNVGGSGATGSSTAVYVVGPLDGQPANPAGATIGSSTIWFQSATAVFPGFVSSANQIFSGIKGFNSAPQLLSLTAGQTVVTGSGSVLSTIAYSSSNTNSTIVIRDSNGNSSFNNMNGTTTTTGVSGSTVMSGGSARVQKVIGSATATFNLPNATTLVSGWAFEFNNNSINNVTINDNGSSLVATALPGSYAYVLCIDNSTTSGVWDVHWLMPTSAIYGTAGLKVTGSITSTSLVAAPLKSNSVGSLINGSISLTSEVVGNLPISQTSGSVSLVNQVVGNLPLSQTSGSISLTTQVSGVLPANNTQGLNALNGSVSLTSQVVGNLPLAQTSGSISLVNQVSGNLPLSQTSGSVSFSQLTPVPSRTIGSVTFTSSTGGALYTLTFPGSQGANATVPQNNGSGNLTWASVLTNPMTTSGDIIIGSGSGIATRLPVGSGGQFLTVASSSLVPSWKILTTPTITRFTTIGGGTYTPSAGILYIKIRAAGGGAGGASGQGAAGVNDGVTGSATVFGSNLLVLNPGTATGVAGTPGTGGTVTSSGSNVILLFANTGGNGNGTSQGPNTAVNNLEFAGAGGGQNALGGGGGGAGFGAVSGSNAIANTGGGGGGGGAANNNSSYGGAGGGAGGYAEAIITQPLLSSYSLTVGAGGNGGAATTGCGAGGNGGSGVIVIEEYYQ